MMNLRFQAVPLNTALNAEKVAFLALSSLKGVGHKTLVSIAESGRRFEDILGVEYTEEAIGLLRRFGARIEGSSNADWQRVRQQAIGRAYRLAELFSDAGTQIIFRNDREFPHQLKDLSKPPHWLFVTGNVGVLQQAAVAVVGTREPTDDGHFLGRYVGACLRDWGVPTVSGLAIGIDQQIHELSLRANVPTIAVLGTGILSDYPRGATYLRAAIIGQGGALVTEYLPRESYSAENFIHRNRLQAALGKVLVPIEWNHRSGTAHTVRFASMLKRPIACLRLNDWDSDRVSLKNGLGGETGAVFTIPGEEREFSAFVRRGLIAESRPASSQLALFSEG